MSFDKTLNKKLFFKLMISGLKLFVSTSLTVQYFRIFFYSKLALPTFLPSFLSVCLAFFLYFCFISLFLLLDARMVC